MVLASSTSATTGCAGTNASRKGDRGPFPGMDVTRQCRNVGGPTRIFVGAPRNCFKKVVMERDGRVRASAGVATDVSGKRWTASKPDVEWTARHSSDHR